MRKLFAAMAACAVALASSAQTHVKFTLSDFNASPTTNRNTTVQALTPFPGNLVTYSSGANGYFYLSNAAVGDYSCEILHKGSAKAIPFQVTVTATNLGVVEALSITSVRGVQTYPSTGKSAWTIAASDARYSTGTNGGGSGSGFPLTADGNLAGFSLTNGGTVSASNVWDKSNVKWWGAVGDGVTDDTVAIQAALNWAQSQTSPKPSVHIPAGNFKITSSLLITNGYFTVYGDGPDASLINVTASGIGRAIYVNGAARIFNLNLRGFKIQSSSVAVMPNGIEFKNASTCHVEDFIAVKTMNGIVYDGVEIMSANHIAISQSDVGIYQTATGGGGFPYSSVWLTDFVLYQTTNAGVKVDCAAPNNRYQNGWIESSLFGFKLLNRTNTDAELDNTLIEGVQFQNIAATGFDFGKFIEAKSTPGTNYFTLVNFSVRDCKAVMAGASNAVEFLQVGNTGSGAFFNLDFTSDGFYSVTNSGIYSDSVNASGWVLGSTYSSGMPIVSGLGTFAVPGDAIKSAQNNFSGSNNFSGASTFEGQIRLYNPANQSLEFDNNDNASYSRIDFKTGGELRSSVIQTNSSTDLQFRNSALGGKNSGFSFFNDAVSTSAPIFQVNSNGVLYGNAGGLTNVTASSTNTTDGRFASSVGTVTLTSNSFVVPIVSSRTNYADRLEATNSSSLVLFGGGMEVVLESGAFKVRPPYYFSGNAAGATNAVNIVAGSNVTVTTNADGRTFTIASTGGGITPTNTTGLPGVVTDGGRGIGTNLSTLATTAQLQSATNNLDGQKLLSLSVSNAAIANSTINSNKFDAATRALFGAGGASGGVYSWTNDVNANEHELTQVTLISGSTNGISPALILSSADTEAAIWLYGAPQPTLYSNPSYGHTFDGPVTMNQGTVLGFTTNAAAANSISNAANIAAASFSAPTGTVGTLTLDTPPGTGDFLALDGSGNMYLTNAPAGSGTVPTNNIFIASDYWIPDGTDRSDGMSNLLNAVYANGGGKIYFPSSRFPYRADSQMWIPNNGVGAYPTQPDVIIEGASAGGNWYQNYVSTNSPVTLDLRYAGTNGGKIETRGRGAIEIKNVTITDLGSSNDVPLVHTIGTVLKMKSVTMKGTGHTNQDAIWLGGTNNVASITNVQDAFQGYGTVIDGATFTKLNRGVYAKTWANAFVVQNCTWIENVGLVAFESDAFNGEGSGNFGIVLSGNTFEMNTTYKYGVVLRGSSDNSFVGNSFWDVGAQVISSFLITNSSFRNFIQPGWQQASKPLATGSSTELETTTIISGKGDMQSVKNEGNFGSQFGYGAIFRGFYKPSSNVSGVIVAANLTGSGTVNIAYDAVPGDGVIQVNYGSGPTRLDLNPLGGNVGINKTNPAYPLDVTGAGVFSTTLMATNGFSSGSIGYTRMPTNTPVDGYVMTAAGTGGYTKWATAGTGGGGTNALTNVTENATSVTIAINSSTNNFKFSNPQNTNASLEIQSSGLTAVQTNLSVRVDNKYTFTVKSGDEGSGRVRSILGIGNAVSGAAEGVKLVNNFQNAGDLTFQRGDSTLYAYLQAGSATTPTFSADGIGIGGTLYAARNAYLFAPVAGTLTVSNNLIALGTITATNGFRAQLKAAFSTNYTVVEADALLACTGTNQLITLPNAATYPAKTYTFLMSSTTGYGSAIVTNYNGSQTILTAAGLSQTITNGQSLTVISDGSNWR